jgi:hypothetical protein
VPNSGHAGCAAQLEGRVDDARCRPGVALRHARQDEVGEGRREQAHAQPAERQAGQEVPAGHLGTSQPQRQDQRTHPGHHQQRAEAEQPTPDPRCELDRDPGGDADPQRPRQADLARLQRRHPEADLRQRSSPHY